MMAAVAGVASEADPVGSTCIGIKASDQPQAVCDSRPVAL